MALTSEQVRPLAPASDRPTSSDDEESTVTKKNHRRRCIKCISCVAALLFIQAIVIIILVFTVFRVRDPIIRMNGVTIQRLELVSGTQVPQPGTNMTLNADVSVKNPNYASFRYQNTTTTLYYRDMVIGEAHGPPGRASPRRTMRMNITVDVIVDRILSQPQLASDMNSSLLTMNTFTRVGGRVNMVIAKHVTVTMNCSVTINTTSQAIQQQRCRRRVRL